MNEIFRKMISESLGINFSFRPNHPHFLISVQAFPQKVITDNKLLSCVAQCLGDMGFELDADLVSPKDDDFTWIKTKKEKETFSVGITNTMKPPFYIIITLTRI